MKIWLTADWHLGEDRMEIMGRPFVGPCEALPAMASKHNALVKPDDLVYILGDVCYQKTPEWLKFVGSHFNGRKILVRGNHDKVFTDADLAPYFEEVYPDGGGFYHQFGDIMCYLTHYPTEGVNDVFNLVGHIHGAWKYQLNMFNVGVDVNNYCPVDGDKIAFHLTAISKYYDNDVWVAYDEKNASWRGKRGKPGTYFRPVSV